MKAGESNKYDFDTINFVTVSNVMNPEKAVFTNKVLLSKIGLEISVIIAKELSIFLS